MKLSSLNTKQLVGILFVVIVGLVIYLPSFKLHFSLLDDGLTILNARVFVAGIKAFDWKLIASVFFEPFNGRVRPGYWLVQSLFACLSFYNSYLFHILRVLLLVFTLFFGFSFLKRLKIHYSYIVFSTLIFIFNIQNFENYYRLGPVEPLIIFLAVLIYLLVFFGGKENKPLLFLLGIITILGGLIKENFFLLGFSLLPVILLARIQKDRFLFKKSLCVFAFSLFSGILVFLVKSQYPSNGVYASNYVLSITTIAKNLFSYLKMIRFSQTPVFELSVLYLIFKIFQLIKRRFKKVTVNELVFIALWSGILVQLLALSPWSFVLNRYLAFININLMFVYAITLSDLIEALFFRFSKLNKAKTAIVLILFMLLFTKILIRNFFNIANYQLYAATDSTVSFESVRQIADSIPANGTVYVNYKKGDSNIEIFEETKWHLDQFYNRRDINFLYLDDSNLCTKNSRYIFDRRSDRFTSPVVFKNNNFNTVASGVALYKPINYGIVFKSFLDRYKYTGWSDTYDFDWSIYQQKGGTCVEKKQ